MASAEQQLDSRNHQTNPSSTKEQRTIVSRCHCQQLQVHVNVVDNDTTTAAAAADCHCPACRKYHVAAFASYLSVPMSAAKLVGEASVYREDCRVLGTVDRIFCKHCYSKLATRQTARETDQNNKSIHHKERSTIHVNMGPIDDRTLPARLASRWSRHRDVWPNNSNHPRAVWTDAQPGYVERQEDETTVYTILGGCSCGNLRYRLTLGATDPFELQHCYCRLCRQVSGSACMTWIPVDKESFEWLAPHTNSVTSSSTAAAPAAASSSSSQPSQPLLIRSTEFGQRHVCPQCASALTIVYDEQPDTIHPAAGGLDDASLPRTVQEMNGRLDGVCHIACRYKQTWYALPRDGLDRHKEWWW